MTDIIIGAGVLVILAALLIAPVAATAQEFREELWR